ncbi:leukemia inhibitory factor [Carettochelys insculpta]|uniref:leukemia inhibitory factor n=1 Tax=Carettochelys insculpta TaxID=44489 RepID=UPI003EBCDFA1
MTFIPAGAVPLLLLIHCRLAEGKALPVNTPSPMCENLHLCKHNVVEQTHKLVASLNETAQRLFSVYLAFQGDAFSSHMDEVCNANTSYFPAFHVNRTSHKKEIMVALYRVSVFLNASLGNITRDQKELNPTAKELLEQLHNTTKTTRGLISNLTCLLCTKYSVSHVDVTYGKNSKDIGTFKKKQQGCQVLRRYVQVISQAAQLLPPHLL